MKKAAEVVDTWLKHQHEEVISKLAKQPKLQREYVQRVLNDKAEDIDRIMKEQTVTGISTDEYKRYEKLLLQNIELLCELEPQKVVLELKKKYYPIQSCIAICTKRKHMPAVAFLLRRSGDFDKSIETYLEILSKIATDLISESNKDFLDENLAKFEENIEAATKVCMKNSKLAGSKQEGEELWFQLLDHLYKIHMDYTGSKLNTVALEKGKELVNKCTERLLDTMTKYVDFTSTLTRLAEKHGEREIQSLQKMFTSMLFSYVYQEKILQTANKIAANNVVTQFKDLSKLRRKGFPIFEEKCAKCEGSISNKNSVDVTAYPCGHMYHTACVHQRSTCYSCMYKETSIFCFCNTILRGIIIGSTNKEE